MFWYSCTTLPNEIISVLSLAKLMLARTMHNAQCSIPSPETPRAQTRDSVLVCILKVLEELKETQRVHERMPQTILHQQGNSASTTEGFPLETVSDVEVMEEKLANPDFMSELVCMLCLGYRNSIQFYWGG